MGKWKGTISNKIADLEDAVAANEIAAIITIAGEIVAKTEERNKKLKMANSQSDRLLVLSRRSDRLRFRKAIFINSVFHFIGEKPRIPMCRVEKTAYLFLS